MKVEARSNSLLLLYLLHGKKFLICFEREYASISKSNSN